MKILFETRRAKVIAILSSVSVGFVLMVILAVSKNSSDQDKAVTLKVEMQTDEEAESSWLSSSSAPVSLTGTEGTYQSATVGR